LLTMPLRIPMLSLAPMQTPQIFMVIAGAV